MTLVQLEDIHAAIAAGSALREPHLLAPVGLGLGDAFADILDDAGAGRDGPGGDETGTVDGGAAAAHPTAGGRPPGAGRRT